MLTTALRCRECKKEYPKQALHVCEHCFGPLEVAYDYAAIGKVLSRDAIVRRPTNIWRYRELLPLDEPPPVARSRRERRVGWLPDRQSLPDCGTRVRFA